MNNRKTQYSVRWWAILLFIIISGLIVFFVGNITLLSPTPYDEKIENLTLCNSTKVPILTSEIKRGTRGVYICGTLINEKPIMPVFYWFKDSEMIHWENATEIKAGDFQFPVSIDYLNSSGNYHIDIYLHRNMIGSLSYKIFE